MRRGFGEEALRERVGGEEAFGDDVSRDDDGGG